MVVPFADINRVRLRVRVDDEDRLRMTAYAELRMDTLEIEKPNEAGFGWDRGSLHRKAFTSALFLDVSNI